MCIRDRKPFAGLDTLAPDGCLKATGESYMYEKIPGTVVVFEAFLQKPDAPPDDDPPTPFWWRYHGPNVPLRIDSLAKEELVIAENLRGVENPEIHARMFDKDHFYRTGKFRESPETEETR